MSDERTELADTIVSLRRELLEAQKRGEKEDLRFRVEEAEVEVQAAVTKEAGVRGGVKFWVYSAEASGKLASQAVHKISLKLEPLTSGGKEDLLISDTGGKPTD